MNLKPALPIAFFALLATAQLVTPTILRAQAPPGPMTPAAPKDDHQETTMPAEKSKDLKPATRDSLKGSWKLNVDDSDDGHKKMEDARSTNRNSSGGNGPYGGNRGGLGGGYPFPGGGGGGQRGGMGRSQDDTSSDVQRLLDPASSLNFTQKPAEVDVVDDRNSKIVFYTDGRKIEKNKDNNYQELNAQWQDIQLVADQKSQSGGHITRVFEVQPGGQHLYETLRIDTRSGLRVTIRYAYDIIGEGKD